MRSDRLRSHSRKPRKDGKTKDKHKPEQIRCLSATRRDSGSELTISIRTADGKDTGLVPMSVAKAGHEGSYGGKEDPTRRMFAADERL